MGQISAKLRRTQKGYLHFCPACDQLHHYYVDEPHVNSDGTKAQWSFNGNVDKPSFTPSMNIGGAKYNFICHYFVTDGRIIYQGDCLHDYKGQNIELPDLPPEYQDNKDAAS